MMRAACTVALVALAFTQIASAEPHISQFSISTRRYVSGYSSGYTSGTTPTSAPTPAPTVNLPIAATITQMITFFDVKPEDYKGAYKTLAEAAYGVTMGIAVVKKASRRTGAEFKPGCSVSSVGQERAPSGVDVTFTAKVTSTYAVTAKMNAAKGSDATAKALSKNMGDVKAADPTRYAGITVPESKRLLAQNPTIKDEVVSGASSVSASILVAFGLVAVAMREQQW
jgi:hypothetical protein